MTQVYIHLPKLEAERALVGGIKLSEKKERTFTYQGIKFNCFTGWLHPNDDITRQGDEEYVCIKLNLDERYCFVGARDLYPHELYFKSLVPFSQYRLGTFRRPQCLICSTVLPSRVKVQGRRLDVPLLYGNSEELYLENVQSFLAGEYSAFQNDQLYSFFQMLALQDRFEQIETEDGVVFVGKEGIFSFRKPAFHQYHLEEL